MKFAVHMNMERTSEEQSITESLEFVTDLAVSADQGGIDLISTGEHHVIEMNICPNPFVLLSHWASRVKKARLGTSIIVVPYWHPIKLAEEAALLDIISDGRLELGLGRGAFQFEFDRMGGGISAEEAREITADILPTLKELWKGDTTRTKEPYKFPTATAVPKPLQKDGPPLWITARHPKMFELAVESQADVMANPLSLPMSEVESLIERRDNAVEKVNNGHRPRLLILRDLYVYEEGDDWKGVLSHMQNRNARFQTLFKDKHDVVNGFPVEDPLAEDEFGDMYELENLHANHLVGTPEEVIEKLKPYKELGVDYMMLRLTCGLPHDATKRSFDLFLNEVLPAFK